MNKSCNRAKISAFTYTKFSHGIDWLSFRIFNKSQIYNIIFKNFSVEKLDFDNANWGITTIIDEHFTITKSKSPTGTLYQLSLTYQTVSIPVMQYNEYDEPRKKLFNTEGIFHFLGAFFRLDDLNRFSDEFLYFLDDTFSENLISRMDYRFDFLHEDLQHFPTASEVFPNLRSNKHGRDHKKGDTLESWDLGNKANKTVFIRMYNKQVELSGNLKKIYLYGDLLNYKSFYRLEYELGEKFCGMFKGFEKDKLIDKIFSISEIVPGNFIGTMYAPKIVVDLSDEFSRVRYIKVFRTMAQNLKNNGINPIELISNI